MPAPNGKPSALVVDDEADIRELLEITLSRMGVRTEAAATLAEGRAALARKDFDLCITDMRLPDGNGISLVQHIQAEHPHVPVAVITAFGNAQAAVESLKAGAFDFVSKPVNLEVLRKLVDTALKLAPSKPAEPAGDGGLLGNHESIRQLRAMIERLARSQAPVHIAGESGTGKELVARLIHARSPRGSAPFVPVNCGAIPTELMESEFFGHLKGSFTGALRDKTGLFQAAEGGTLFLDEVADLPLHMQVKLLRAVQERAVRPVGSEAEVAVNVRIISATHKNLAGLAAEGISARTCTTGSTSSRCGCRRCARASKTSRCWPRRSSRGTATTGQRAEAGRCGDPAIAGLPVPRQRARAGKRAGTRRNAVRRSPHHCADLELRSMPS